MSEHTKGRLHIVTCDDVRGVQYLLPADENVYNGINEVATVYVGAKGDIAVASARRLVACWNACQGISTGDIEHGVVPPVDKRIYARIESARDELIEALREIVSDASDRIAVCPITLAKARAILAKHAKGGSMTDSDTIAAAALLWLIVLAGGLAGLGYVANWLAERFPDAD